MFNRKSVLNVATAAALSIAASQASAQLSGPFYDCISTDLAEFEGNIVDAAIATPELSTLVTAVTAANLGDTLATAENITVYAPTDDAFGNVPSPVLDAMLGDVDLLTQVLTYHVTAEPSWKADPRRGSVAAPTTISSLQGQSLSLAFKPGAAPMVNQAMAQCQGVQTTNGVVWIIDSVLLPQF